MQAAREYRPRSVVSGKVAAMLARARLSRGWSVRQAARQAGVSPGTIAHLEKARRAPSVRLAEDLIEAYELGETARALLLAEAVPDAGRSSSWHRLRRGASDGI